MEGKTVVVTGASRGIGASVARAFAADGTHVVCAARDVDSLDVVVGDIEADGGSASAVRADVRDEFDVERLMEQAAQEGGPIDVVVANAGVFHGTPGSVPLSDVSYTAFDDTFRTNVRGVFSTVKEALPHMAEDGRFLVPSGSVARESKPGMGAYAASKGAAEALVRGFAADLDQSAVVVDPGLVATDLTGTQGRDPDEVAPMFVWAGTDLDPTTLEGVVADLRAWKSATR